MAVDPAVVPTLTDVAGLLHARTFVSGVARGTFDEDTYPTGPNVETLTEMAAADLAAFIAVEIPEELHIEARRVAGYQAAALVETSYFTDADSDTSGAPRSVYTAIYLQARETLRALVQREVGVFPANGIATIQVRAYGATESEDLLES